jgi:hypothetical protein
MIILKQQSRLLPLRALLFATGVFLFTPGAQALTLAQFTDCIGPNTGSYGLTCQLDAATYLITSQLTISRNAGAGDTLTVQGTSVSSLSDTTLKRDPTLYYHPIMSNQSAGKVSIYEFTFDGNRGGITHSGVYDYECAVSGDPFSGGKPSRS